MLRNTMLGSCAAVLVAVTVLVGGLTAPAQAAKHHEWGRISAANGKLHQGCHRYTYRYDLRPPEGDWALETFLTDSRGRRIGSGAFVGGQDPTSNVVRYRICRATTSPGSFMIRGKLSVANGPNEYVEGWIQPALFRLSRR